jgi:hypothetical protein
VVNPFADTLTFLDDKTRTRRDHMKYLTLIQAIALLHQHQRPSHEVQHRGKPVRYIEVTADDIQLANRLANEVLGRTLDELPPQTRRLLEMVRAWVGEECARCAIGRADLRFTRRQLRAVTGWGDTQLKVHLSRLADLEYILIHRVQAGQGYAYELLYAGEGSDGARFMMGLSSPDPDYDGSRSGGGRPLVGARSGGGRGAEMAQQPQKRASSDDMPPPTPKPRVSPAKKDAGLNGKASSYPQAVPAVTAPA